MPIPKGELVQQTEETAPIAEGNPIARAPSGIPKGEPVGQGAPPYIPEELQREDIGGTFGEKAGALGSAAITMGRGALGEVVSGVSGLANLGLRTAAGQDDALGKTVEHMEWLRDAISGEGPQTEEGKAVLRNLSKDSRIKALMEDARESGERTLEATGSPAAATAVQTAMEFLPGLVGARRGFNVRPRRGAQGEGSEIAPSQRSESKEEVTEIPVDNKARKQDIKNFNEILGKEGINVRTKSGLFNSLQEIGENVQKPGFAKSLERVHSAVTNARNVEKETESVLWRQAREGGEAFIPREEAVNFRRQLDKSLDGFLVEDMPKVEKLLKRFDKNVEDTPGMSSAKLSALQDWRKSINANMPSDKQSPEAVALNTMKRNLDTFLENKFATDMIKGDPESIARWRTAIDKSAEIKKKFDSDKIIRRFAQNDATAEELRSYIFNAASVGAKASSERTIKNLKRILGPDSDEMAALRQESLFNIMEPLIKERPDFDAFSERYQKFVKKNPGVVKELFPEKSRESLRLLNSAAKSAEVRRGLVDRYGSFPKALSDIGAVGMFGHGIAQAGLKVRVAKTIFDRMLSTGETPIKKEMMQDFLGYDPNESIFRSPAKRTAAIEGVTQAAAQEQEDNE